MKALLLAAYLLLITLVDSELLHPLHVHSISKRHVPSLPLTSPCTASHEGKSWYDPAHPDTVWICKSSAWIPFKLTVFKGGSPEFPGSSCKEIKDSLTGHCYQPPQTGPYHIEVTDPCSGRAEAMTALCEMDLCGGGWTLVWKHSFMEVLPLTTDMYYFSSVHQPCTSLDVGWCNIPNKGLFKSTEMMIVAYHDKTVVYAYTGRFNHNIDSDWSGGMLLDPQKCVDHCTRNNGVPPAPSNDNNLDSKLLGIAFDKVSPSNPRHNCDTLRTSFTNPQDCRWADCGIPESISSRVSHVQMTYAIYIR